MADRLLTINLRNYLVRQPVRRRHMKLSRYVRNRVAHYVKVDEENVKITGELNNLMIKSYSKSMLPLKLNVKIENGIATVHPFVQKKEAAAAPAAKAGTKAAPAAPKTAAKVEAKPAAKAETKPAAKPSTAEKK
jgi:hypothetical protein